jgi:hypothetical protein
MIESQMELQEFYNQMEVNKMFIQNQAKQLVARRIMFMQQEELSNYDKMREEQYEEDLDMNLDEYDAMNYMQLLSLDF